MRKEKRRFSLGVEIKIRTYWCSLVILRLQHEGPYQSIIQGVSMLAVSMSLKRNHYFPLKIYGNNTQQPFNNNSVT